MNFGGAAALQRWNLRSLQSKSPESVGAFGQALAVIQGTPAKHF